MTQQAQHTPGALSAARCILRQIELLDPARPLDDREGSLNGLAGIIDEHVAAPDLLAACKTSLDALDAIDHHDGGQHVRCDATSCPRCAAWCKAWDALRAAIAKAEPTGD